MSSIPYIIEERPDTGLNNSKLGVWIFLASEVMLFGGLFSTSALIISNKISQFDNYQFPPNFRLVFLSIITGEVIPIVSDFELFPNI